MGKAKLPLPFRSTDPIKLADWVELIALTSPDGNASKGDLESALSLASVTEPARLTDTVESLTLQVFIELADRSFGAADAYPFEIKGSLLQLKPNERTYSAYLFCLCLSYFEWSTRRSWEIDINPWLLFEELSALAAEKYIDGESYRFGTSRKATQAATKVFQANVNELCRRIGEGEGFRPQPTLDRKDDKVDLVAWKNFADGKTAKLVMFGQCAGGANFESKISDVNPDAFWKQWMIISSVSPHLRSFYIPHRIPDDRWDYQGRYGGIIFDRCRVAYWAFKADRGIDSRFSRWYKYVVSQPEPKTKPKAKTKSKSRIARRTRSN